MSEIEAIPATPAKEKRRRRERVHRKGPGRGWVYRWMEWDRDAGRVVKRTSVEHEKKSDAEAGRSPSCWWWSAGRRRA